MRKKISKIFLSFLVVVLSLSGFKYIPITAQENMEENKFKIEEIDPEAYGIEPLKDKAKKHRFLDVFEGDPRDNISVVVELEDQPVVEKEIKYGKTFFRTAVNLEADTERLKEKQAKLRKDIEKVDSSAKVKESFTYLSNSMVVDLKAESFDVVKKLPGVKRLFVEREYYIPQPQMNSSNELVGAVSTWEDLGYKGEGMRVFVLDTGLDTDHHAFNQEPADAALNKEELTVIANKNKNLLNAKFDDGSDLFTNLKVPFTYDYAEEKISVKPNSENYNDINHGTHVAGTVAGKDGARFKGVAPEAQLLISKVFNDQGAGATDRIIMSALEDAVLLGADAINMSLGSDVGFTSEADDFTDDLYKRINDSGILLSASAGNAHSNAMNNTYGLDYTLASDPDHGIVGSPSTYGGPLSIASSENTKMPVNYFTVSDEIYTYTDTNNSIAQIVGDHDFVIIPRVGKKEDYEGRDVEGKVVFVQRGEITFEDKMLHAEANNAKAIIIFGSDDTSINMAVGAATIPSAYITKSAAENIIASEEKTLYIAEEQIIIDNPRANLPSSFSSMGTTNILNIKPELTAPGGQIYSALPSQGSKDYGLMSGTSMAAPHVAGGAVLLKQYITDKHPELDPSEVLTLMDNLLMSTANIIRLKEGHVSVREQGAGVMDVAKAINSNAYLSVDPNQNGDKTSRPKLELGDNPSADGQFTLTFKVTNFGDEVEEYTIDTTVTAPGTVDADFGEVYGMKSFMLDENVELDATVSGPDSVSVEAGSTEIIELQLQVTQSEIAKLSKRFINGFYLEGFVELTNKVSSKSNLNIPYLGFVGDWETAQVFDYVNDNDIDFNGEIESLHSHVIGSSVGESVLNLGTSIFHKNPNEMMADYDRLVVSPNDDGYFDTLDTVILGQLRSAESLNLLLKDENGDVVYDQNRENAFKSFYHGSYNQIVTYTHFAGNSFDEVTFDDLSDGKYSLVFEADLGYRSGVSDTLEYDIYVDRFGPTLESVSNKNKKFTVELSDDQFLLYSELAIGSYDDEDNLKVEKIDDIHTPYGENINHQFSIDLENIELDSSQVFLVTSIDSGYNETAYLITPETVGQPENEVWALEVNETRTITAQNYELIAPTFEVENSEVVTVDQDGKAKALDIGETTIHISDVIGDFTIDVHVVENKGLRFEEKEYQTRVNEIIDLDLLFNDQLLESTTEDLIFNYDEANFERNGNSFKALKEGNYTVKAFYSYKGDIKLHIIEEATEESITNSEINEEITEKIFETTAVIKVEGLNKTILQLLIDNFKELPEDVYSEESLKEVRAAYDQAVAVLESEEVVQEEIDHAIARLIKAQENLKYLVQGLENEYEIKVGQNLQLNPVPVEGNWVYDENLIIIERHLNGYRLVGLTSGETVVTFTNKDGQSKETLIKVQSKDSLKQVPADPKYPVEEDDKDKTQGGKSTDGTKENKHPEDKKENKTKEKSRDSPKNSNLPRTGTSYALLPYGFLLVGIGLLLFFIRFRKGNISENF